VFQNGGPGWSWETFTDRDGNYKVDVASENAPDERLCVRVQLPQALNSISSKCGGFGTGSNRMDFDLPPGRIIVTLVPQDGPIHETPILLVLNSTPGPAVSVGVTITSRTERSFEGLMIGKHRLRATTMDYSHDFDVAEVVLAADDPVKAITLTVPYSR
jgi:hypothetical protein